MDDPIVAAPFRVMEGLIRFFEQACPVAAGRR
jgi:hypothetical protein